MRGTRRYCRTRKCTRPSAAAAGPPLNPVMRGPPQELVFARLFSAPRTTVLLPPGYTLVKATAPVRPTRPARVGGAWIAAGGEGGGSET